jgi:hypothetical protein
MASEAQVVVTRGMRRVHHGGTEITETILNSAADTVLMSFSVPSVSLWCRIHKPRKATRVRPNCAKQSQFALAGGRWAGPLLRSGRAAFVRNKANRPGGR